MNAGTVYRHFSVLTPRPSPDGREWEDGLGKLVESGITAKRLVDIGKMDRQPLSDDKVDYLLIHARALHAAMRATCNLAKITALPDMPMGKVNARAVRKFGALMPHEICARTQQLAFQVLCSEIARHDIVITPTTSLENAALHLKEARRDLVKRMLPVYARCFSQASVG